MKIRGKKINLFMIFFLVFACFILMTKVNAASYDLYTVKYNCPVRTEASDKSTSIKNGNDTVYVYKEQLVDYIKSATGPNEGNKNATWYAVKFDYAAREYTGYVAKACMYDTKTYSYNDDSAFEESIKVFPESYKSYLRKLHAIHPNWTFKADNTDLDWGQAAEAESQKGTSAISHLYPSLIFRDSVNPNGIIVDGTNWYAPAKEAVMYYMDPRNFLSEKNIFMYQSLSYNANEDSSVKELLKGSFMEGVFTENGRAKTYADAFIEAAKESNVSSVHLASRALLEMGTTMSSAASGTVPGYEGYYNFYNIGAYSGEDNYLKGLEYAKNHDWNSVQKAITGGANFIGSSYINKGQDTIYFQKFNVSSNKKYNTYTHQYQTNIMAPETESASIYKSYKSNGKLGNNYTFVIPVYNNRPASAFKVSRTDTVGGSTPPEESGKEEDGNNNSGNNGGNTGEEKPIPPKPVISPETKIANAGYSLATGYLTKVAYGSDVSEIRTKIANQDAKVGYMNSAWQTKTSGRISTGDIISVDDKVFQIAVYGDTTGDGILNSKDLLAIQKYILGLKKLDDVYIIASDATKDGNINSKDLLRIQKSILGLINIEQ